MEILGELTVIVFGLTTAWCALVISWAVFGTPV